MGKDLRYPHPSAEVFLSWGNRFEDVVPANNSDYAVSVGPVNQKRGSSGTPGYNYSAGTQDCGGDLGCFNLALQNNCQVATSQISLAVPHPVYVSVASFAENPTWAELATITTQNYYEIRGLDGGSCVIYEKFLGGSISYNEKAMSVLVGQGEITREEMDAEAAASTGYINETYAIWAGRDATCVVTAAEFTDRIDRQLRGEFSFDVSVDLGNGETIKNDPYVQKCTGSLYGN